MNLHFYGPFVIVTFDREGKYSDIYEVGVAEIRSRDEDGIKQAIGSAILKAKRKRTFSTNIKGLSSLFELDEDYVEEHLMEIIDMEVKERRELYTKLLEKKEHEAKND